MYTMAFQLPISISNPDGDGQFQMLKSLIIVYATICVIVQRIIMIAL